MAKPECVIEESRERSGGGECGGSWVTDRYEMFPGKLSEYKTIEWGIDWEKLDNYEKDGKPYYLVFDYIYQKYMSGGNVDSKITFGKMLQRMGCVVGEK